MEGEIEAKEQAEIGDGEGNLMGVSLRGRWLSFKGVDYSIAAQPLSPLQLQYDWEWEWKRQAVQAKRPRSETRGRSDFPIWHTRAGIGERKEFKIRRDGMPLSNQLTRTCSTVSPPLYGPHELSERDRTRLFTPPPTPPPYLAVTRITPGVCLLSLLFSPFSHLFPP